MEVGIISSKVTLDTGQFSASIDKCIAGLNALKANVGGASASMPALGAASAGAATGVTALSASFKGLTAVMGPLLVAFGAFKAIGFIKEGAMLASRVEQTAIMMNQLGASAGYTTAQMAAFSTAIQKMGITESAAQQSLLQLIEAHVDLGEAANLARIAQDAAKIGNINSSEAMTRVTKALSSGQVEIMNNMGLMVRFGDAEAAMRKELGRELTNEERVLARVNATKKAAIAIQGSYIAGVDTAAGKIQSFDRHLETFQLTIGKAFTPMMATMIDEITRAITGMTASLKDGGGVEAFGRSMNAFLIDAIAGWQSLLIAMKTVSTIMLTIAQTPLIIPKQISLISGDETRYSKAYDIMEEMMGEDKKKIDGYFKEIARLDEKSAKAKAGLLPKYAMDAAVKKPIPEIPKSIIDEKATKHAIENVEKWLNDLNGKMASAGLSDLDKLLEAGKQKYLDLKAEMKESKASPAAFKALEAANAVAPGKIKAAFFTDEFMGAENFVTELQRGVEALVNSAGLTDLQKELAAIPAEVDKIFKSLDAATAHMGPENKAWLADLKSETTLGMEQKATEKFAQDMKQRVAAIVQESEQAIAATQLQLDQNASYMALAGGMSAKDNFLGGGDAMLKRRIANDTDSQINALQGQVDAAVPDSTKFYELNAQLDELIAKRDVFNNGKFQLIKDEEAKAQIESIRSITRAETIAKGLTDTMVGPMQEALAAFAETGHINMKALAGSLLKTVQAYAAQMTAILLMKAAFEGLMSFIDPYAVPPHAANAILALQGAGIMGAFVAGSGLANMAHSGITNIPEDGTWMLQKNERVVDSKTNADLKEYLAGANKPSVVVNNTFENSDEEGVLKALPALRQTIIDAVAGNIASGGVIRRTIQTYV